MASREETRAALRAKFELTLDALDEAARHSTGLEKRVEELARDLDRAVMEASAAMRSESLSEPPECCPECGGTAMRPLHPPVAGDGEKK